MRQKNCASFLINLINFISRNLSGLEKLKNGLNIRAAASFGRALYTNDQEPSYWWHRAEAYLELSDFDSCISNFLHFKQLLASRNLKSNYVSFKRMGLVLFTWSQILIDQKRYKEALKVLNQVLECGYEYPLVAVRL